MALQHTKHTDKHPFSRRSSNNVSPARITRPHHGSEVSLGYVAFRVLLAEVVELHTKQIPVFVSCISHDEVEVVIGEARLGHFALTPSMKLVSFRNSALFVHAASQQGAGPFSIKSNITREITQVSGGIKIRKIEYLCNSLSAAAGHSTAIGRAHTLSNYVRKEFRHCLPIKGKNGENHTFLPVFNLFLYLPPHIQMKFE